MKQINITDRIFVTVTRMGHTLLSTSVSGSESFDDVARSIRGLIPGQMGLVSVLLRNGSQGWSERYSLRF